MSAQWQSFYTRTGGAQRLIANTPESTLRRPARPETLQERRTAARHESRRNQCCGIAMPLSGICDTCG